MKGLCWSSLKHNNFITGGGKFDGSLRLWDSISGKNIQSINTNSQICNLVYSYQNYPGYFLCTLGYPTNKIIIWQESTFGSISKIEEIEGHAGRVLYCTVNSKKEEIVTSANDGFIKFWDCFKSEQISKKI